MPNKISKSWCQLDGCSGLKKVQLRIIVFLMHVLDSLKKWYRDSYIHSQPANEHVCWICEYVIMYIHMKDCLGDLHLSSLVY